jgi:hypothetical protein
MIVSLVRLLVFSLLAAAPVPPITPADNTDPFTIGVLRRDGLAIPFATFDGKNWSTPWPRDLRYLDLPVSLAAVPERWFGKPGRLSAMTAWIDGVKGATVTATGIAPIPLGCSRRLVLRTTYRPSEAAPPLLLQPYPKVGLVVAGTASIDPIEILDRTSSDWGRIEQVILEPFAVAEQTTISRIPNWKHPMRADLRRRVPVEVEALYRAPMDIEGWTAYYVEAIKRFPPGPEDDGCGLVTSVGGWVLAGPNFKREFRLNAVVSYCDRKHVSYFLPLGRVTANGKVYWIAQHAGYGEEQYVVSRPTRDQVEDVAGYSAAFCPMGRL